LHDGSDEERLRSNATALSLHPLVAYRWEEQKRALNPGRAKSSQDGVKRQRIDGNTLGWV
jgi:hypothetical protein